VSAQPALFAEPAVPSCVLSPCGRYRYALRIPLGGGPGGVCLFIMANPSTAIVTDGVFQSDPTVTRCIGFARSWGMSELVVANVRAWRETDPKKVPPDPLAIGEDNDAWLRRLSYEADRVICGWGKLGGSRGPEVIRLVRFQGRIPFALKLNGDGSPAHPLYLTKNARPVELGRRDGERLAELRVEGSEHV
jgi:hypothetical protein